MALASTSRHPRAGASARSPTFEEITKTEPEKSLLEPVKRKGGRNNQGRITTRHQGGGHKRRYRVVDFKRRKDGVPAKVAAIEYDPNRSARHRPPALRRRGEGVHPRARRPPRRPAGRVGARGRHQARQRAPARQHPDRHARAQRRAQARPRRPDGPQRRLRHPARRQGRGLRRPAPALRRDAPGAAHLPRDRRPGREHRPREHLAAARRAAAGGSASARPCAARP